MLLKKLKYYFSLTKPRIMLLVVLTGATALIIEGSLLNEPVRFLLALLALYLTGGSANALNQYFERDRDALMDRTARRRPLPMHRISERGALIFSIAIALTGVGMFAYFFNYLSAVLSLATILFYSFFYTLYLKPTTPQNIVVGGAAGAMVPVGVWVAASGGMAWEPWILFLIVFLWTPPHFWALALFHTDDYRESRLPMMPVVRGEMSTLNHILIYSLTLVLASLLLLLSDVFGWFYGVTALLLGGRFLHLAFRAKTLKCERAYRRLFLMSIHYLFVLFLVMIVDSLI